ncbi:unnamed protein product [Euphydryas editha]|uniref:Transposase n=1 Tax=Euphydryas editha TaxID=104508 RepID=A0AAU9UKT9_EUPED|nr:unnamed protein product [Euphydryas editha]
MHHVLGKVGSRNYKDYTDESLRQCLTSIENPELTQRKVREQYDIPRRIIINHLKLLRSKNTARPRGAATTFTFEEEALFVSCIQNLSEYGFPLTTDRRTDLRIEMLLESYHHLTWFIKTKQLWNTWTERGP